MSFLKLNYKIQLLRTVEEWTWQARKLWSCSSVTGASSWSMLRPKVLCLWMHHLSARTIFLKKKKGFTSGSWLLFTLKSEGIPGKSKDDYCSVRLQGLGLPLASPSCQYPQVIKREASHSSGVGQLPSLLSHPPLSKSERLSGHFCLPVSHTSSPSAGSCLRLFTTILSPLNTTYGI